MPRPRAEADELLTIPGIGSSLAADLRLLGITRVADLAGRDAQALYGELQARAGAHVDRCVLYAFRCAVYYANAERPDDELTRWWSWKDGGLAEERGLL